jgi:hypothetical protein
MHDEVEDHNGLFCDGRKLLANIRPGKLYTFTILSTQHMSTPESSRSIPFFSPILFVNLALALSSFLRKELRNSLVTTVLRQGELTFSLRCAG